MKSTEIERLIKSDILSIENRVRHAFNQGFDFGYKEGIGKSKKQLKTGHWIQENSVLICSICDARVARYDKYSYCPSCGAKMVEPQERSDKA